MYFTDLIQKLDEFTIPYLKDCDVTANKINGISLLIKDDNGSVVECIILSDERNQNPPKEAVDYGY